MSDANTDSPLVKVTLFATEVVNELLLEESMDAV